MSDSRRRGDTRDFHRVKGVPLNLTPTHKEPLRWFPWHGNPTCIVEWATQTTWQTRRSIWTAVAVALILYLLLFGVPGWVPFVEAS